MPVTQKDIATRLGLTVSAVSMALRNHPRIGEKTRRRVQQTAARLGYIVNPAYARRGGLRHGARARPAMPLALIIQQNPGYRLGGEAYFREVGKVAAALGYELSIYHHGPDDSARRLGQTLYQRGVEAVIIGPIYYPELLEDFPWHQFSLAACEAGHYAPPCHLAMPDVAQAIREACQQAARRGYRRLAFAQIQEPVRPVDWLDRYGPSAYFKLYSPAAGLKWTSRTFRVEDRAAFLHWVERTRPDVVLGQTEQFYWWLVEDGWKVPGDLAFINLRMDPDRTDQGISGFEEDHVRTAHLACQIVDMEVRQFFRGPPRHPARMLVHMPWREGRTLPQQASCKR